MPTLHDPPAHKYVAVSEDEGDLLGYVAWNIDQDRRHGEAEILAVKQQHRRTGTGTVLCEPAFPDMRDRAVEVAAIGTGGDAFHPPARALYSSLGCIELPVAVSFKQL